MDQVTAERFFDLTWLLGHELAVWTFRDDTLVAGRDFFQADRAFLRVPGHQAFPVGGVSMMWSVHHAPLPLDRLVQRQAWQQWTTRFADQGPVQLGRPAAMLADWLNDLAEAVGVVAIRPRPKRTLPKARSLDDPFEPSSEAVTPKRRGKKG